MRVHLASKLICWECLDGRVGLRQRPGLVGSAVVVVSVADSDSRRVQQHVEKDISLDINKSEKVIAFR
jgi:hypothetical protein